MKSFIDFIRRKLKMLLNLYDYGLKDDYRAVEYWRKRLSRHQFNLQGVGRSDLSQSDNLTMYQEAEKIFAELCSNEKIDFESISVLDVGCGMGYYTNVLIRNGVKEYIGIDITDVLIRDLELKYPKFVFSKKDISTEILHGQYDLIIMIDVAQHIVNEEKFSFAMQNIKSCLSNKGIFIVTADLTEDKKDSFYEKSKSMEAFKKEFIGYQFGEPRNFRDKFIFTISYN